MVKFRDYIMEMIEESVSFSDDQKNELNHFILNVLMNPETAKLLRKTKTAKTDEITISKKDAKAILDNISSIREFILKLPRRD